MKLKHINRAMKESLHEMNEIKRILQEELSKRVDEEEDYMEMENIYGKKMIEIRSRLREINILLDD